MAVEHRPAGPATAPGGVAARRPRGLRRGVIAAFALAAVLVAGAVLWAFIAPGQLVKYGSIDQTAVADGQFTLYVDASTGLPLATPQSVPLHVEQRIHSLDIGSATELVAEDDTQVIAGQPQQLAHRYVIDRRSNANVADDRAWAWTSGDRVDRSGTYSFNLPFDTGSGPYRLWMNETGTSYAFTQVGEAFTNDGVTVVRLKGTLPASPLVAAYVDQLKPQGIAATATLDQLKPALKAQGIDVDAVLAALVPALTPAEGAALQQMTAAPITLVYTMTADTTILVEKRTGGIVSLEKQDQTVSMAPDLAGLAPLLAILQNHASIPAVGQALAALGQMQGAPPQPVFRAVYAQTPASVQEQSDYANGQGNTIDLVERWIPLSLAVAGLLLAGIGAIPWVVARRRAAGASRA